MGTETAIEWTDHTLFPKPLASLKLSLAADAVRLKMARFMAGVTKSDSIGDIKSEVGKVRKFFDVMSAQVTALSISAISTGVSVANKNLLPPSEVFDFTAVRMVALRSTILVGVMIFSSRSSCASDVADLGASLRSVMCASSVTPALFGRLTHLATGFIGHLPVRILHRRYESGLPFLPRFTDFPLRFLGMSHTSIIHSTIAKRQEIYG